MIIKSIAEGIVEKTSEEIGIRLSLSTDAARIKGDTIVCVDERGFRYAIICYWGPDYVVKSVVREHRKGRAFTWLVNGQAAKNAVQVAFWDEGHRYYLTLAEYMAYMDDLFGTRSWARAANEGHIRLPERFRGVSFA